MLTQIEVAEHLDLSQPQFSQWVTDAGIDWRSMTLDELRVAYIRKLRAQAAGHRSSDGLDLVRERVLTERVDRELKQLTIAEKRGQLVNVAQVVPALEEMMAAFKTELLARDQRLADDLTSLHGIAIDVSMINEHTNAALAQLAGYEPGSGRFASAAMPEAETGGADLDDGMVAPPPEVVAQGDGAARAL